jgi:1,4-dihydroxy-2-naphthoate octaprenyltransferase
MADSRFDALVQADTRLSRSFIVAVAAVLGTLLWAMFISNPRDPTQGRSTMFVLMGIQLASYVWYAVAAGAAARVLGEAGWKYSAWIMAAPFLAQLPIPIVSNLIAVSPLSIKFLLGSQLQTAIRQEGFASIHESVS